MKKQITLTFMSGAEDGRMIQLETPVDSVEITFGRIISCTVPLTDDPEVSRLHARLSYSDQRWRLEDCGSSNGTYSGEFAQEKKLKQAVQISEDAIFRVGRTRFRLEKENEAGNQKMNKAQAGL